MLLFFKFLHLFSFFLQIVEGEVVVEAVVGLVDVVGVVDVAVLTEAGEEEVSEEEEEASVVGVAVIDSECLFATVTLTLMYTYTCINETCMSK